MDEQLVVEQEPITPVVDVEPVNEAPLAESIQAHAEQFGPKRDKGKEAATVAEPVAAVEAGAETPQQKQRRRAKSQQATAEDVPRIKEMTRQLRERDEELARLRAQVQPIQAQPQQVAPRAADPRDPEPQPTDTKFGGDYGMYLREVTRWEVREQKRQDAITDKQTRETEEKTKQEETRKTYWADRAAKARMKYQDMDDVLNSVAPTWNEQSVIHALIDKHENGIDLWYYLDTHPDERDSIVTMPEHQQVVALSLLLQRFESNGAGQAGTTGSVAAPRILKLPPRPLNPVRTEAHGAPAPTDGASLSIADHAKRFAPQRRR